MGSERSAILQWRKFEFFNVDESADVGTLENLLQNASNQPASVESACSGRSTVLVGDNKGFVHSLSRSLQSSAAPSFPAHDAPVAGVWAADAAAVIVTLAHPPEGCSEVKVWAPDRLHEDNPTLLRLLRPDPRPPPPKTASPSLMHSSRSAAPHVSALALHPNVNMLAFGFSTGAIMLYRGDLGKDHAKNTTCRVVVTLSSAVTNLHFQISNHVYTAPTQAKGGRKSVPVNVQKTNLLVTTETNVYTIACTHRDKETTTEMDSVGCRSGCSAVVDGHSDHSFVIARDDALYCYGGGGRAGCFAFPGHKKRLHCHRGYALVSSAVENSGGGSGSSSHRSSITLYDLSNKVIALTFSPSSNLVNVVTQWGGLYGVTNNPTSVIHFREKDLHTKMEILFKKNQYDIAVSLAKGESVSSEGVAEILKQYGDWLYSKGDLSMAVHQYIKTIPHLEPSYVIKKFLSSEHMSLLAAYLEALHARNLHTPDHSSLLLNCYTRHNQHNTSIQAFIKKHSEQVTHARKYRESQLKHNQKPLGSTETACGSNGHIASSEGQEQVFSSADVEVLVGVCHEGGFYEEALQLTQLHKLHSLHLDILCNDTQQHRKAVLYIRSLDFSSAVEQMLSHGSVLARGCPDETLELLIELATDYTPDNTPLVGEAPLDSYLAVPEPECVSPEVFESVVCGDSLLAIRYIEGVTKRHTQLARPQPKPRLYEMLLAEYLHQLSQAEPGVVREAWEHKVQGLISDGRCPIDPSMACLLCDRHQYQQGKLLVWQQNNMWSEVLQYYVTTGREMEMLAVCEAHEAEDKRLWLTALRLLTAPAVNTAPDTAVLTHLLDKVDSYRLLPPLEVIELLSSCEAITLGQVRGYLLKLADREEAMVAQHRASVDQCVADTEAIREQIHAIHSSGLVFTESNCDACHKELEFPTVHFFCKHSFHQHCFVSYCSSSEDECPVCLPRHQAIREHLNKQASERSSIVHFNSPPIGGAAVDAGSANQEEEEEEVFSRLSDYLAAGLFTDYSGALPHLAPMAGSKQLQRPLPSALEASQVTESRLRMAEATRRGIGAVPPSGPIASEGRLRQGAPPTMSPKGALDVREGRLRATEPTTGTALTAPKSEGRLRASATSSVAVQESEGRMRAGPTGGSSGRKFGGGGFSNPSSPAGAVRSSSKPISTGTSLSPFSGRRRPQDQLSGVVSTSISAAISNSPSHFPNAKSSEQQNPFESNVASSNPFGDDFETEEIDNNPFGGPDEKNPFTDNDGGQGGEKNSATLDDEDYDKNLNPFGE